MGETKRPNMQLIDHKVLKPGRHRFCLAEFITPKIVSRHRHNMAGRRIEIPTHHIAINDHAATHTAVQVMEVAPEGSGARILATASNLPSRMDIGAIYR